MGFLVCSQNGVRMLSAGCASPMERIAELLGQALEGLRSADEAENENARAPVSVRAAYQE